MNVSCSFRPEHDGTDMSHCRPLARLPETGYTGENRVQAGGSKQERGRACQKDALLSCQPCGRTAVPGCPHGRRIRVFPSSFRTS
ncbi:hypothetical protein QMY64_24680 [Phocaeicola dorei]|nr:hypothetical protein QMY64_24680 [Phocaeicola dorei]